MFLFFDLNDTKFVKLLYKKKINKQKTYLKSPNWCQCYNHEKHLQCLHENSKIDSSFVCKPCQTPKQKKETKKGLGLRLYEIHDIKNSKIESSWECQTCMSDEISICTTGEFGASLKCF